MTNVIRLTIPSDANIYGNVHGGTILKLMEEAGTIAATRYCNMAVKRTELSIAVLVRIEHMDFLLPMMIGEVAELTSKIVYTSSHSLLVQIEVHAEDIIQGIRRKTNQGRFWYVPIDEQENSVTVPPMVYDSPELRAVGEMIYNEQKTSRSQNNNDLSSVSCPNGFVKAAVETVPYSTCCLSFLVGKNDVSKNNVCRGGVLLKLMDECAGIVSAKHCRSNVVTACLHATNFHRMIKLGSLVTVVGQATFTSSRSMEVEVIVEFERPFDADSERHRAVDAFFTYVSLDPKGKALPVPPLKILTEEEQRRFDKGQQRYDNRKLRQQQQQQQVHTS